MCDDDTETLFKCMKTYLLGKIERNISSACQNPYLFEINYSMEQFKVDEWSEIRHEKEEQEESITEKRIKLFFFGYEI